VQSISLEYIPGCTWLEISIASPIILRYFAMEGLIVNLPTPYSLYGFMHGIWLDGHYLG
jgi:hypothetical protein